MSRPAVAFRYVFLTPPKPPVTTFRLPLVSLSIGSILLSFADSTEPRRRLREFARSFMDGQQFLREPSELAFHRQYLAFLSSIATHDRFTRAALAPVVGSVFGQNADALVASAPFRADVQKLGDAIAVLTLASSSRLPDLLATCVRLYRAVDLIARVATSDPTLDGLSRRVWERTPLELPAEILPHTPPEASSPSGGGDTSAPAPGDTTVPALTAKLAALETATHDLLSLRADDLLIVDADDEAVSTEIHAVRARISALEHAVAELRSDTGSDRGETASPAERSRPAAAAGRGSGLVVRAESFARLMPSTRALLEELALDVEHLSVPTTVERLEQEAVRLGAELAVAAPTLSSSAMVRVGNTVIPATLLTAPAAAAEGPGSLAADVPEPIKMYAIGNLLLTAMNVIRYEAGEIAHIENVLIGEEKERETRRLRRTEETLVREVETTREEERDLQTTERLEMQREAQNTIRESQELALGTSISAGYGPFVQASFNTQYASQSSVEDTARNAATYSREITEKTASKITERIREEQTIRVIQEFEERNRHALSGVGRDEHIIGLFQWVDKIYHAQVFDYGVRLIIELVVPEPGYFLQRAIFQAQIQQKNALVPPDPIDFGPGALTTGNYGVYARKYGVKNLQPPPEPIVTLSVTLESQEQAPAVAEGDDGSAAPPGSEFRFTSTREVKIPTGYKAVEGWVAAKSMDAVPEKGGVPYGVRVTVGRRQFSFVHPDDGTVIKGDLTIPLSDEVGSIPITLLAHNVTHYVAGVEITCYRTSTAMGRWQLQTYEAILEAHKALEAEYRERVAEMAAQEGITFGGRNPGENRRIERNELKRVALSMLTRQHFSDLGAYAHTVPVPHIQFDKAEEQGVFIGFFERVFEWENIVYELYPYFWGAKNRWASKLLAEDTDPLHKAFHEAGAARVQLVVRPDYEQVFLHYMNTGQIWQGADLPPIGDQFQAALLAEILERRSVEDPHQRIPVGEPWEVRLPTTLVRVSPTGQLPRWTVNEDGTFVPVDEA